MDKQTAIKTAAPYFKNHTVDEFHITADGQAFFDEGSANNHAQSLGSDVVKVTREEAEKKQKPEPTAEEIKAAAIAAAEYKLNRANEAYDKVKSKLDAAPDAKKPLLEKAVDAATDAVKAAEKALEEAKA
jgi:outer membrane PBP1 activator LpoA protein